MTALVGWARQQAELESEPRLLLRSHCPCCICYPRALGEAAFLPLLPPVHPSARTLQCREASLVAKRPSPWVAGPQTMENRTFDKFVQLLGDYFENTHLDMVEEGAAERVGVRADPTALRVSPQPGLT